MPRVPDILIHTGLSAVALVNMAGCNAPAEIPAEPNSSSLSSVDQAEIKALQAEVPTLKKDHQLAVVISP